MNSIIDSVMASRRLKIFTAYYAMLYVVINLILNLVATGVPFFGSGVGKIIFKLVSLAIQAPFIYGLIRGLITKDYSTSKGFGAFGETKNFASYATYIAISLAYELVGMAIEPLVNPESSLYTLGSILYVVYTLLRFFLNGFLIKMYFDCIDGGRVSLGATLQGFGKLLSGKTMKFVSAELFMLVIGGVSMIVSTTIANILPSHWSVSIILACINSVQYGFIILSWPVYYLYYRWAFEE